MKWNMILTDISADLTGNSALIIVFFFFHKKWSVVHFFLYMAVSHSQSNVNSCIWPQLPPKTNSFHWSSKKDRLCCIREDPTLYFDGWSNNLNVMTHDVRPTISKSSKFTFCSSIKLKHTYFINGLKSIGIFVACQRP